MIAPQNETLFLHLQWFAARDEGRTEEPTETKIKKAREEGKVAKSVDIVAASVLLFPMIAVGLLASFFLQALLEMMKFFLDQSIAFDLVTNSNQMVGAFFSYLARLCLPILLIALVAAVASNLLQVGFLFTLKPIKPDVSRIAPRLGIWLKRSLFSGEALFNIVKQLLKVIAIAVIAWVNIQSQWLSLMNLIHVSFATAFQTLASIALLISLQSAVLIFILAIPDYLFQRWRHKESLKMSKEEIKEERKQQEGDPLVRSRLRERMRVILQRNMMANVPQADVIITNPTHFAIGLQWDAATMSAPTVIAKGQDLIAQAIKEIGLKKGVPIVENKPLARALFAVVNIGDQIPSEYWEVISKILAEIYRMGGKHRAVVS